MLDPSFIAKSGKKGLLILKQPSYFFLRMYHELRKIERSPEFEVLKIGVGDKSNISLDLPPHFWKIILQFFYDLYGCIYAKKYDG